MTPRPIFINGRYLTQRVSGVQRYAHEMVAAIDRMVGAGTIERPVRLLVPPNARETRLAHVPVISTGRLSGHAWDQVSFARAARGGVALSLAMTGPVALTRQVVVLHDAAVQRHPAHFSRTYVAVHTALDKALARRATIATVSEFSQRELAEVLELPAGAIVVAPNGAEHLQIDGDSTIVHRLGLTSGSYFLTLGNHTANKNLAVAIRAHARLARPDVALVAVGAVDPRIFGTAGPQGHADNVLLPGRLSDPEVAGLMQSARALIFPSIYEGFGIPPLEAFANGCPVLASTAEAVREVCGDAAEYFTPHDDARLAELMRQALADDGRWRDTMLARGKERLSRYAWATSARTLIAACERIAAGSPAAAPA